MEFVNNLRPCAGGFQGVYSQIDDAKVNPNTSER
jgi:hypothetical protein